MICAWLPALCPAADCALDRAADSGKVAYINDGDTLQLEDGRRVRLLGINTPEIDHERRTAEPLGHEARNALAQLAPVGTGVKLRLDSERKDRYGRLLAHVYTAQGENLAARLLDRGLGMVLVIPPNLWHSDCYMSTEHLALAAGRGLWREPYFEPRPAASIRPNGSFRRVTGRVTGYRTTRRYHRFLLDNRVILSIQHGEWPAIGDGRPELWLNRQLVARGWVQDTQDGPLLRVRHRSAIERPH